LFEKIQFPLVAGLAGQLRVPGRTQPAAGLVAKQFISNHFTFVSGGRFG